MLVLQKFSVESAMFVRLSACQSPNILSGFNFGVKLEAARSAETSLSYRNTIHGVTT